jgi:hypothetical protein
MTGMPLKAEIDVICFKQTAGWLLRVAVMGLAFVAPIQAQNRPSDRPPISAVGIGHPPAAASSPTQARAMAERGALLDAIREAARKSGRAAPSDYRGSIKVGAVVKGFRITRITPQPDGSVEIEVSVPRAGVGP